MKKQHGMIKNMVRFIKMWLLLRALQEDTRYNSEARNDKDLKEKIAYGGLVSVGILHFLSLVSLFGLGIYFLPLWIRVKVKWYKLWDKKLSIDVSNQTMQELQSLVDKAQGMGFIVRDGGVISITSKGDDFIGWVCGVETLLTKYPRAWGIVVALVGAIIFTPYWGDIIRFIKNS